MQSSESEEGRGELSPRQRQILNLVVSHYIKTGEPVGSRTLVKSYRLPLGPATVRNEMADLEELGYLQHPHTSAGRIPTDKGYRAYVNDLEQPSLTSIEEEAVTRLTDDYLKSNQEYRETLTSSIKLLAEVTKMVSIAASPEFGESSIEKVQLVDIGHNRVLVVLVTRTGRVETVPLSTEASLPAETLGKISGSINRCFGEHPVKDFMRGYLDVLRELRHDYRNEVRSLLERFFHSIDQELEEKLLIEGALQVIHLPEFHNLGEIHELFSGTKHRDQLVTIMRDDRRAHEAARVHIGTESGAEALTDLSLVVSDYKVGDDQRGTIGIIGPRRMNYRKVIASVDHIARVLSRKLSST